jgi:drug/metabolite transporter (DMT)-like permease
MTSAQYRLGLVFVTISAIAWSLAGVFTRAMPTLDSATLLSWRGIYGALGIGVLIIGLDGRRALNGFFRMGWAGWLFAADGVFGMICYVTSLKTTTVAHVAVIYASIPFVAAAFAWVFLKERPAVSAIVASLTALIGIAIMVGLGNEGHWTGDLLAFGMTVTMAIGLVLARRYQTIPLTHAAFASTLFSGIVCWPLGAPLDITSGQTVLLALFGIVNSSVGFGLFTLGARFLPAVETALIGSLDAPLSPLWVWMVFGEVPGMSTIVGGLMVFVAVGVYLALSASHKPRVFDETPAFGPEVTP